MAAFVGMDPAAIRRLAATLGQLADQLEQSCEAIQRLVDDAIAGWEGGDAQDFHMTWGGEHRSSLQQAVAAVRRMATSAEEDADEQDTASSAAGLGSGGTPFVGPVVPGGPGGPPGPAGPVHGPQGPFDPTTYPLPALPPSGSSPADNAAWWNGLSPEQQAAVLAQHPEWVANMNGVPAAVRDRANRTLLDPTNPNGYEAQLRAQLEGASEDEREIIQAKLDGLEKIRAVMDEGNRQVLGVDITGDQQLKAIVAVGNVDTAEHVAVFTPGLKTTVKDKLADYDNDMAELYAKMGQHSDSVATVSYLGYEAPQLDASVLDPGFDGLSNSVANDDLAQAGAGDLADFYQGINAIHGGADNVHVTALGHSYGSLTTSLALQHGAGVDDAVFFGSPGLGLDSLSDLGLEDGHAYYTEAGDDYVGDFGAFDGDPSDIDGIRHISSEESPFGAESRGHSDYLDNNSTSQHNMAVIATGNPDLVVDSDGTDYGVPGAVVEDVIEQGENAAEWTGDRLEEGGEWLGDRKDDAEEFLGGLLP